jgi:uncharacterized protein (TIGR03437 family)
MKNFYARSYYLIALAALLAPAAWCQNPSIAGVSNTLGQPAAICPGASIFAYGTYPADNRSSFSATVGGETAPINIIVTTAGVAYEINLIIPIDLPAGLTTLVISHSGTPSNSFPITLEAACPAVSAGGGNGSAFSHANGAPVTGSNPAAPGETIRMVLGGLGATNPAQALGTTTSSPLPAAVTPTLTVNGIQAQVQSAQQTSTTVGNGYAIIFTVPANAPPGGDSVLVTSGGIASNEVQLPVGTQPLPAAPAITALVNGASFAQKGVAPGSFLTVYASGLTGPDNLAAFPATEVNGISVEIGGELAPISSLIASQGQMNVLVPSDLPPYGESVPVTILSNNGPSSGSAIQVVAGAPGIFVVSDPSNSSRHVGAALFPNTAWYVMSAAQATALGLAACTGLSATATCGQPAKPGDYVELFVTGLGAATPNGATNGTPLATGLVAPASGNPLYETVTAPTITVNNMPATVQSSVVAPGLAGVYQVNFQIPASTPAGDATVQISLTGSSLTDSAVIAVQ